MDTPLKSTSFLNIEKRIRTRKRGTLRKLQEQIEFFFGDANLQHDHVLLKAIKRNDGFVLLDALATRTQILRIANDLAMIIKAIQNSSLLQINKELTMVRRIASLRHRNADARTVYVERLPFYVDHEWLRSIFGCCGSIEYISLPKYKNSGEVKGFAFIEYSKEADAEKACQVLNSIYTKTSNIYETDHFRYPTDTSVMNQNRMKRRRSSSSSSSDFDQSKSAFQGIQLDKKRRKVQSVSSNDADDLGAQSSQKEEVNGVQRLNCADSVENDLEESKKVNDAETGIQTVERRRRKRKKKVREESPIEIPPLYVIHKSEWLRLKSLYKSLQRSDHSKLKAAMAQFRRLSEEVQKKNSVNCEEHHSCLDTSTKKTKCMESNAIKSKAASANQGQMSRKTPPEKVRRQKKVRGKEKIERLIQQLEERERSCGPKC